jgi:hypothetical protein
LIPKASFERGQASRNMNHPIITVLDNVEGGIPLFRFGKLNAEGMDQAMVNNFGFSIHLQMERSGVFEVTPQERPESFPKCTEEMSIMIRDNVGGETKMSPHMSEKEIHSLSNSSSLSARDKNGHFGEATHNHPNGIMMMKGHGKTGDEVHRDRFPGTGGNR